MAKCRAVRSRLVEGMGAYQSGCVTGNAGCVAVDGRDIEGQLRRVAHQTVFATEIARVCGMRERRCHENRARDAEKSDASAGFRQVYQAQHLTVRFASCPPTRMRELRLTESEMPWNATRSTLLVASHSGCPTPVIVPSPIGWGPASRYSGCCVPLRRTSVW